MRDDPAQFGDRNLRVHFFAVRDESRGVSQAERMVFAAPPGFRDSSQTLQSATGELADAARLQPVIAEERKRIPEALGKRRQRWIRVRVVLVEEINSQAGR